MNIKQYYILIILIVTITGCTPIISKHPIGEAEDSKDHQYLKGNWQGGDECYFVSLSDNGGLILAYPEFDDKNDKFVVHNTKGHISKFEGTKYLNLQVEEDVHDVDGIGYFILEIHKMDDDNIILWGPDKNKLEELSKNEKYMDKIKYEADCLYIAIPPNELAKINKENNFFDYKEPFPFKKLK